MRQRCPDRSGTPGRDCHWRRCWPRCRAGPRMAARWARFYWGKETPAYGRRTGSPASAARCAEPRKAGRTWRADWARTAGPGDREWSSDQAAASPDRSNSGRAERGVDRSDFAGDFDQASSEVGFEQTQAALLDEFDDFLRVVFRRAGDFV